MAGSVLLIDDDVDVLRGIGNYFERLGYEVTRELSGEAGGETPFTVNVVPGAIRIMVP